jgi:hypothetical protein
MDSSSWRSDLTKSSAKGYCSCHRDAGGSLWAKAQRRTPKVLVSVVSAVATFLHNGHGAAKNGDASYDAEGLIVSADGLVASRCRTTRPEEKRKCAYGHGGSTRHYALPTRATG